MLRLLLYAHGEEAVVAGRPAAAVHLAAVVAARHMVKAHSRSLQGSSFWLALDWVAREESVRLARRAASPQSRQSLWGISTSRSQVGGVDPLALRLQRVA